MLLSTALLRRQRLAKVNSRGEKWCQYLEILGCMENLMQSLSLISFVYVFRSILESFAEKSQTLAVPDFSEKFSESLSITASIYTTPIRRTLTES